jgi:hypothetical protein
VLAELLALEAEVDAEEAEDAAAVALLAALVAYVCAFITSVAVIDATGSPVVASNESTLPTRDDFAGSVMLMSVGS